MSSLSPAIIPSPETTGLTPTGPKVTSKVIKTEGRGSNGPPSTKIVTSEKERMFQYKGQWAILKGLDPQNLTKKQVFQFSQRLERE